MATNHVMHYCKRCGYTRQHLQPATSHVLHLILSILTCGLWLGIWIAAGLAHASQKTCATCGKVAGLFG